MGGSVNRIILVGRLGHDADLRYLPDGQARTRFSLATDRPIRTGSEPQTDWHAIVCWAGLAEFAVEHLTKGRLVCVTGRLAYRTYERDGQTHRLTEVIANDVILLDRRPEPAAQEGEEPAARPGQAERVGQADQRPPGHPGHEDIGGA